MASVASFFSGILALISAWFGYVVHGVPTEVTLNDRFTTTAATSTEDTPALRGKLRILYKGNPTPFAIDARHAYLADAIELPDYFKKSDADSFRIIASLEFGPLTEWVMKDANAVYMYGDTATGVVADADPRTFLLMASSPRGAIFKDARHAYGMHGEQLPFDVLTLRYLGNEYFTDSKGAYFIDGAPVPDADLDTFGVLKEGYAKDKATVYFRTQKTTYDPESFKVLDQSYVKDKTRVYFSNQSDVAGSIEGADPLTFDVFPHAAGDDSFGGPDEYAKDAAHVYFDKTVVPGADVATFVPLNDRYGKDSNHVYLMDQIVQGAVAADFQVLPGNVWFGKDKKHVFTGKNIIPEADPDSFMLCDHSAESCRVLGGEEYNAYDKNHLYFYEKIIQ